MAQDEEIVFRLSAKNLTSSEFAKARRDLLGVGDASKNTQAAMAPLSKGVKNAANEFARMNPVTARFSSVMGDVPIATLAAVGAVGALVAAAGAGIRHIVALGDQITTMSAKTGIGTDFLQRLQHATERLDVPFEAAVKGISKFQANIGRVTPTKELTDALGQLDLRLEDLKALDPEQQFQAFATAMDGVRNQSERAAIAQALFGRAGIELLPLLNREYRELQEQADKLGVVIEEDLLVAGDELGENWALLVKLGATLAGQTAGPLVKSLRDVTEAMIDAKAEGGALSEAVGALGNALSLPLTVLKANVEGARLLLGLLRDDAEDTEDSLLDAMNSFADGASVAAEEVEVSIQGQIRALLEAKKESEELSKTARFLGVSTKDLAALVDENGEAWLREAEAARRAAEQHEDSTKKLRAFNQLLREGAEAHLAMAAAAHQQAVNEAALADAIRISPGTDQPGAFIPGILGAGATVGGLDPEGSIPLATEGIGDIVALTEEAEEAQRQYNEALAAANDIAQLFEGNIGDVIGQTLGAVASLQNLSNLGGEGGIFGGLKGAFSQGQGGQGGILGFLGGVGGVLSAAGPLVGFGLSAGKAILKGLKSLFGRSGKDAAKEIGRDLGATVSSELAKKIAESGRPVQLAIADIFREGGFDSTDTFAREIGDLFSSLQQGKITKPEIIKALEESVPLLIENFSELGEEGQAEVARIIDAAKQMGIEFEGLDELIGLRLTKETLEEMGLAGETNVHRIRDAAEELGISFEALKKKIDETFAPQTLEEIAKAFDLTNDEVRALGEELGIHIQTNLERMAASVNLSVQEFEALRVAAAAALNKDNISAEELLEFLEATGLTAEQLAEKLGIEVSDGAGSAADEASRAADETSRAADEAGRLADNYERAGRAVGGIGFNGGGFNDFPITGAANEFQGRVTGPRGFFIEPGVTEDVSISRPGTGSGGGVQSQTVNVTFLGPVFADEFEFNQRVVATTKRAFQDNEQGIQDSVAK